MEGLFFLVVAHATTSVSTICVLLNASKYMKFVCVMQFREVR